MMNDLSKDWSLSMLNDVDDNDDDNHKKKNK